MSVLLVTGAARGIGAATARSLAARGWDVALVGLEPDALASVAGECGPRASWHEADISSYEDCAAAVAAAVERHGRLDAVFANAGIALFAPLRRMEPDDFARQVSVNLVGTFNTLRACAEPLIAARGYALINASSSALSGVPGLGAYAATKAGVESLADVLRAEWAPHGTAVGTLYCHWVDTDLVRGSDARPAFARLRSALPPPLNRTASVDDVAAAVVRAVDARASRVFVPGWVRGGMPVRHAVRLVTGVLNARESARVESAWDELAASDGARAASRPVGRARAGT